MTKASEWFYGIRGIQFIWHGEWNDPELIWHKHSFNYHDLEDPMWDVYKEECNEKGVKPDEDAFPEWVKKNAHLAREFLQAIIDSEKN